MSVISIESIKAVAEDNNITDVPDDVAEALGADVEYRLREIVQEAMKFMKHSKRTQLSTDDINMALKLSNNEILYGYSFRPTFPRGSGREAAFLDNRELDLKDIVSNPLPKCPREASFQVHWLAIDGVVPNIPQNLEPDDYKSKEQTLQQPVELEKSNIKHVLSPELELYYKKVTMATLAVDRDLDGDLSTEESPSLKMFSMVLKSLSSDSGLHQLVPYFSRFISKGVADNLDNHIQLKALMRISKSLLLNPHIIIEPYLHQLLPAVLTCIVGKQLCLNPFADDHWSLREYSAQLVALVCER
eukprot:TRINITY_DN6771_c0_g1_i1.p1 TRINITY_DN6771_c0_g1~~TRINITY_DN6771_c0_g1_i1.p1  ORF type:complete len:302 (+),score=51.23 TRINITY_DN6771_c0_g1_i1:112-1017(+)